MSPEHNIAITGLSAICASGNNPGEIFDSLLKGEVAISEIQGWDIERWPCRAGGVIGLTPRQLIDDRKLLKLIKKTDMIGIYAAEQALQSAGISGYRTTLDGSAEESFAERFGVYAGTSAGHYDTQYDFLPLIEEAKRSLQVFGEKLSESVSPMWLLRNLPNNVVCHVGIRNNLKGANACITNHGTSGSLAIIEAFEGLRIGDADRAVAVGHEAPVEAQTILYYQKAGLLTEASLTPFDAHRSGSLLGEGGAALVLETEQAAAERSAPIHGTILGKGCSSEAQGLLPVRLDGDGIVRAIHLALEQAGLEARQIGMIVCHGNGTKTSDHSEGVAIRTVFGAGTPPITCFKWAFGHPLSASGSIDTVLALTALERGIVPGIASLKAVDPALQDLRIATTAMQPVADTALILSRGFGGQNTALIVRGESATKSV
jgi:3-oxoacyl-[acyl-carrier-protein] synthase-1